MIRLICVAIGYLFGLFQTSYIYGRIKGMDIREHGSGNAGATNALRTLGWKAGLITFLGDCFKCVFAVLLVRFLFDRFYPNENISVLVGMYAALGVILGHNFPCYLKFHGGKGISATAGLFLSLDPILTLAFRRERGCHPVCIPGLHPGKPLASGGRGDLRRAGKMGACPGTSL